MRWTLLTPQAHPWQQAGLAFVLGILATLAWSPFDTFPVYVIGLALVYALIRQASTAKRAFWLGFAFFMGLHGFGLYWIANALLVFGDQFKWLVPLAVLVIPLYLAVFAAAACWLWARLTLKARQTQAPSAWQQATHALLFASLFMGAEYLRGALFFAFPWNVPGYIWAGWDAPLQSTAFVGIYGLSWLTVAVISCLGSGDRRLGAAACVVGLVITGAGYGRLSATETQYHDIYIRLVQPNVPQALKWRPDLAETHLRTLEALSGQDTDIEKPLDLVIWPESATSISLADEMDYVYRAYIMHSLPLTAKLITGAVRYKLLPGEESPVAFNSLLIVDRDAAVTGLYDKHRLVPFGEYVPFRDYLPLEAVAGGKQDFRPGPPPEPMLVSEGGLSIAPYICYEAIFSGFFAPEHRHETDVLMNLTNDAWYGRSAGPHQHLAISKVRAVEEGKPMIRVANTGISAVFDGYGRLLAALPLETQGVLDHALPKSAENPTVFSQYQNLGFWLLMLLGLLPSVVQTSARYLSRPTSQT